MPYPTRGPNMRTEHRARKIAGFVHEVQQRSAREAAAKGRLERQRAAKENLKAAIANPGTVPRTPIPSSPTKAAILSVLSGATNRARALFRRQQSASPSKAVEEPQDREMTPAEPSEPVQQQPRKIVDPDDQTIRITQPTEAPPQSLLNPDLPPAGAELYEAIRQTYQELSPGSRTPKRKRGEVEDDEAVPAKKRQRVYKIYNPCDETKYDKAAYNTFINWIRSLDHPDKPSAIPTKEERANGIYFRFLPVYEDEYKEEIVSHMFTMQSLTLPSRGAMISQPDVVMEMRRVLAENLQQIALAFGFRQETLFLAINILDRYLSKRVVWRRHYQLVGMVCLWIAAKYEDFKECTPSVVHLRSYCANIYDIHSFSQMEGHVLDTLDWVLGHPTAEAWLRAMVNVLDKTDSKIAQEMVTRQGWDNIPETKTAGVPVILADYRTQSVSRCILELMMLDGELVEVPPCAMAEAALIIAKVILFRKRERRGESPSAQNVAAWYYHRLTWTDDWFSHPVYAKYKGEQYENASCRICNYFIGDPANKRWVAEFEDIEDIDPFINEREEIDVERLVTPHPDSPTGDLYGLNLGYGEYEYDEVAYYQDLGYAEDTDMDLERDYLVLMPKNTIDISPDPEDLVQDGIINGVVVQDPYPFSDDEDTAMYDDEDMDEK